MSLKPFTYPFPETRFLHAGPSVYKFKIRYGDSIRGEEIEDKEVIIQELEDSIRAVLANMDNLQPFVTKHFIVFPYKSKWERVSHLKFKQEEVILTPYPFVFTLYVEMKWFTGNLPSGKPTDDSPLELVLAEKKAEEAMVRKRRLMEEPSSPGRPGPHRAKIETSSEALSNQKPQKETKRNREGEAQQEYQDMLASDATDVQEQDSKLGHSLPELVVPPLQHSNPPPPKEPRTSGFLAFLSTLLRVRHFFRKSWQ
ncbi:membrane-anchored junction protein isoform X2 [Onychomys torridus]|uniref:membrane-anchored junction protein isoform X2 n=1 Tax=Onychomys torridus TaxID=38674 RepID=UPI00167F70AB|nr:membrane-anchored junction protein isoform X2 [Onychomys torridus]